jgi:hypothetical protein
MFAGRWPIVPARWSIADFNRSGRPPARGRGSWCHPLEQETFQKQKQNSHPVRLMTIVKDNNQTAPLPTSPRRCRDNPDHERDRRSFAILTESAVASTNYACLNQGKTRDIPARDAHGHRNYACLPLMRAINTICLKFVETRLFPS